MVDAIEILDFKLSSRKDCDETKEIVRIENEISYAEFFENFLLINQPCVIENFVSEKWASRLDWILCGKPHFEHLQERYGYVEVSVADCNQKYYNVQKKAGMPLSEFLKYWDSYVKSRHGDSLPCLYMKDWHFIFDFPEDNVYRVPKYFASDWLNEYLTECPSESENKDDYRFIYMGPKGSWTPLHADVFTSFSWSVNICGRKKWLLFPPGQDIFLRDKFKHLAYDATSPELDDTTMYPDYKKLTTSFEVIQEVGEAIFVPSGWHHQVWNLDDTISINHNWVNGCNIESMWLSLLSNLQAVKKEVDDCKEMEDWAGHCQLMLRAIYGMNYIDFFSFLNFITKKRLDFMMNKNDIVLFGDWSMGENHVLFDILSLQRIFQQLLSDTDFTMLDEYKQLGDGPQELMRDIETVLNKYVK